jgi:hypothetical protein
MKSMFLVFCVAFTLHHAGLAQGSAETRPLVPAVIDDADSSERQMARLEKAAQRYLDLANASTDQKATADFLRLYEEKEKAIAELRKQTEADRKSQNALRAITSWGEVASEAADRAMQACNDARLADVENPKTIEMLLKNAQDDDANASKAREEVVALIASGVLGVLQRPLATGELNRIEEKRRMIAMELEKTRQAVKK